MLPGFRLFQRLAQRIVIDGKARLQQSLELLGFFGIDMAVDHRGVNKKRSRGKPQLVLAKIARALVLAQNVIDESLYFAPSGHACIPPLELDREEACQSQRSKRLRLSRDRLLGLGHRAIAHDAVERIAVRIEPRL